MAEPAGGPLFGTWGFDLASGDPSVKPGDQFFRYANGRWLDSNPIPADRSSYGLRMQMSDRTEGRLHDLLERAVKADPATLEGKAGAFYRSFMDERRIESLGSAPLKPELARVRQGKDAGALAALMGRSVRDFEASLFQIGIDTDLKHPDRYALYIGQGGLGLPDRDYYLQPGYAKEKAAYLGYVARLLNLLGWPDSEASAQAVVAFETRVAEASWSSTQQRDVLAAYNPMTVAELGTFAPGFAWRRFLAGAGLAKVSRVVVAEKSAFPKLAAIYAGTPVATLRAWQAFHIADQAAPYLSRPFTDASFELRDRVLAGQKEQKARWKLAITAVGGGDFSAGERFGTFGTLGFGVGQLYAAAWFPPTAKAAIEALVVNVQRAFRARIEQLDWMEPATRQEALHKLDTYKIKVGYPDRPRDYTKVTMRADDLLGNVRRAAAADWAFQSGRLFGPVDTGDWGMTPQTNDAYNGSMRDIVFPAGILQAPMFDPKADPAVNYGAIGAVIGHELTHGFDDQGRKIDAAGALRDWWTPADARQYEERAHRLGAQYARFEPLPGAHINGDLTMGENIADLGGLTIALDAYRASLKGQPAPVLDGLTGDQRVFLGWARAWCTQRTDDVTRKMLASDPHSPSTFRVLGPMRNIDAWYEAFGVKPGDAMYLSPEQRVRIW